MSAFTGQLGVAESRMGVSLALGIYSPEPAPEIPPVIGGGFPVSFRAPGTAEKPKRPRREILELRPDTVIARLGVHPPALSQPTDGPDDEAVLLLLG